MKLISVEAQFCCGTLEQMETSFLIHGYPCTQSFTKKDFIIWRCIRVRPDQYNMCPPNKNVTNRFINCVELRVEWKRKRYYLWKECGGTVVKSYFCGSGITCIQTLPDVNYIAQRLVSSVYSWVFSIFTLAKFLKEQWLQFLYAMLLPKATFEIPYSKKCMQKAVFLHFLLNSETDMFYLYKKKWIVIVLYVNNFTSTENKTTQKYTRFSRLKSMNKKNENSYFGKFPFMTRVSDQITRYSADAKLMSVNASWFTSSSYSKLKQLTLRRSINCDLQFKLVWKEYSWALGHTKIYFQNILWHWTCCWRQETVWSDKLS